MLTALKLWTNWASALRKEHTLQSNVNCAVKSSAVPKVTQSRNLNCTNLRIFQHTLDITVQLKLKVKLNVCGGGPNGSQDTSNDFYAVSSHTWITVSFSSNLYAGVPHMHLPTHPNFHNNSCSRRDTTIRTWKWIHMRRRMRAPPLVNTGYLSHVWNNINNNWISRNHK